MQSDNEFESIISIVKSLKGDDEDLTQDTDRVL